MTLVKVSNEVFDRIYLTWALLGLIIMTGVWFHSLKKQGGGTLPKRWHNTLIIISGFYIAVPFIVLTDVPLYLILGFIPVLILYSFAYRAGIMTTGKALGKLIKPYVNETKTEETPTKTNETAKKIDHEL